MLKVVMIRPDDCDKEYYIKNYGRLSSEEWKVSLFFVTDYIPEPILSAKQLDDLYRKKDRRLFRMYKDLCDIASDADIFIVEAYNVLHPDFILNQLNHIYTVLTCADDPPSSYLRTVPYAHAFDHAWCISPVYGEDGYPFPEKLKKWGFKNATWAPMMSFLYDPGMTEKDIYERGRPIDILYVGKPYGGKIEALTKLKRVFGRRFKIYGFWKYWGFQGLLYTLYKRKPIFWWRIRPLPQDEFVRVYCDAKIGFNMHLENNNIGNFRMYHLALNGVMQICDFGPKKALNKIYEVGKEVVGYHNIDEAIDLVRYYLDHDDELKVIAAAGFRRARKDYVPEVIFAKLMEEIKRGMINIGIKRSKDGEDISLRNEC